ncbi:MAG: hypothetical protein K1X47_05110 [Cyclobacteriaceae bacterium]|nr:hypothetical protein [Cyclobacteriaceae bacterium]
MTTEDPTPLYVEAGIQDQLLQSYRRFQLIVQSSLLLACVILFAVAMFVAGNTLALVIAAWMCVAIFSRWSASRVRKMIQSRVTDVDYWQRQILDFELQHPERTPHLTNFKIHQKTRAGAVPPDSGQLLEKDKGHTRMLLDTLLIRAFGLTWLALGLLLAVRAVAVYYHWSY